MSILLGIFLQMGCLPTCFLSVGSLKKATFFRSAMTPSKSDNIVGSPGGSPKLLNASICSANMFLLCATCLPTTKVRLGFVRPVKWFCQVYVMVPVVKCLRQLRHWAAGPVYSFIWIASWKKSKTFFGTQSLSSLKKCKLLENEVPMYRR